MRAEKKPSLAEKNLHKRLRLLWKRVIDPATEEIQAAVKRGASPVELAGIIERVLKTAELYYDLEYGDIVGRWKAGVDLETRIAISKGLSRSLGVDISAVLDSEPVKTTLALATLEAANLIKTIPRDYLGKVAQAVNDTFRGVPLPEGRSLSQHIAHTYDVSDKRAVVIARDQTSKLIGSLNKVRQESVGIEEYTWSTVKDSRVAGNPAGRYPPPKSGKWSAGHHNHWKMQGARCKWADPTVYSTDGGKTWVSRPADVAVGHPGHEIQCRCRAQPVIDLKKIMANIELT